MSYTPTELIAALDRHDVYVTKRKLTDWSKKGLLPPLKRIGLGQGKGTQWFWENDDVLQQAISAVHFLSLKYRADFARGRLWLAGFDVPTESGKATWLGEIANRKKFIEKSAARSRGGLEGLLSSWNKIFMKEIFDIEFDGREIIEEFLFDILQLIYHPHPDIDFWERVEFLGSVDI